MGCHFLLKVFRQGSNLGASHITGRRFYPEPPGSPHERTGQQSHQCSFRMWPQTTMGSLNGSQQLSWIQWGDTMSGPLRLVQQRTTASWLLLPAAWEEDELGSLAGTGLQSKTACGRGLQKSVGHHQTLPSQSPSSLLFCPS